MKKELIPNYITVLRIFGSIYLMFTELFSTNFYIVYTLCGFSDVLDGVIARATNNTTVFGAKLDSIADLMFYAVMLVKIFPYLLTKLPNYIFVAVMIIILIRIVSYMIVAVKFRNFCASHTYLNKLTGLSVFVIPYFAQTLHITAVCTVSCGIAIAASVEELIINIYAKAYNSNTKTLIGIRKNK